MKSYIHVYVAIPHSAPLLPHTHCTHHTTTPHHTTPHTHTHCTHHTTTPHHTTPHTHHTTPPHHTTPHTHHTTQHTHTQPSEGMMVYIDDECLRPGQATDETLLDKFNKHCLSHAHYESRASKEYRNDHTMQRNQFRLVHYAGKVFPSQTLLFSCMCASYHNSSCNIHVHSAIF